MLLQTWPSEGVGVLKGRTWDCAHAPISVQQWFIDPKTQSKPLLLGNCDFFIHVFQFSTRVIVETRLVFFFFKSARVQVRRPTDLV